MATPNVLIIDDEAPVRAALAEELKREGYNLLFATNGQEGLELLRQVEPSVILVDLRMPVMGGLEFLSSLKLKPSDPYAAIVLTAFGDATSVKACYDAGVTIFLKKPFDRFEIRGPVRNAIAVKELTARLEELVQERTADVEQREREVTALNRMVQLRLVKLISAAENYQVLRVGLHSLAEDALLLAERARPLTLDDEEEPPELTGKP